MSLVDLEKFRKNLHRNPELSGLETKTAEFIKEIIPQLKPDRIIEGVGGNGLIFIYDGDQDGPGILIRCDMDALPIHEINTFEYKSTNKNVSHKCGHDGHMAIVAGLAESLLRKKVQKGKVILLFQPAEETGEGALRINEDSRFRELKIDFAFALHNLPGYEMHQIVLREGIFNASVTTMILKFTGKTAHAAEPEHGRNPSYAIAELVLDFNKYMVNNPDQDDFVVITPVYAKIGELAYGTAAGYGESHFTIRCWTYEKMKCLKGDLENVAAKIAMKYQLEFEINYAEDFIANQNDSETVDIIRQAARKNNLVIMEKKEPFKWGEDFGVFTQKYKGAMFGLGSGINTPALHNPDYDFPDEIIETGVKMFRSIIDLITY